MQGLTLNESKNENDKDLFFLGSHTEGKTLDEVTTEDEPPWHITLNIRNTPVTFKKYAGADTSVELNGVTGHHRKSHPANTMVHTNGGCEEKQQSQNMCGLKEPK